MHLTSTLRVRALKGSFERLFPTYSCSFLGALQGPLAGDPCGRQADRSHGRWVDRVDLPQHLKTVPEGVF